MFTIYNPEKRIFDFRLIKTVSVPDKIIFQNHTNISCKCDWPEKPAKQTGPPLKNTWFYHLQLCTVRFGYANFV